MDCVFCQIIASGDARLVYSDDTAVAFLDIQPWRPGHTIVVPRAHYDDASSADGMRDVADAVAAVVRLQQDKLGAQGVNVVSNVGEVAGQSVFHLHVHVVPRAGDAPGLRNLFPSVTAPAQQRDLDEVYARLTGQ